VASPKFSVWRSRYAEGKCVILPPDGAEDQYLTMSAGVPLTKEWPDDVTCRFNPEHPKDIELTDNLYGGSVVVISKRARAALEKLGVKNVEYLPVQILNHKKKVAAKDYFVLNPPAVVDCLDLAASGAMFNPIKKDLIMRVKQLVIDEDKVPASATVFRVKGLPSWIIVRAAIVKGLEAADLEGLVFQDPAEFRGV
jgi:hypothetical protein